MSDEMARLQKRVEELRRAHGPFETTVEHRQAHYRQLYALSQALPGLQRRAAAEMDSVLAGAVDRLSALVHDGEKLAAQVQSDSRLFAGSANNLAFVERAGMEISRSLMLARIEELEAQAAERFALAEVHGAQASVEEMRAATALASIRADLGGHSDLKIDGARFQAWQREADSLQLEGQAFLDRAREQRRAYESAVSSGAFRPGSGGRGSWTLLAANRGA